MQGGGGGEGEHSNVKFNITIFSMCNALLNTCTKDIYEVPQHMGTGLNAHVGEKIINYTRKTRNSPMCITNMPDRAGTHVLKPNGHPWYYDTALSGGVGGKANTRIGNQTATWQGSNIIAGPKGLKPGEEIFVPYTHGSSYILTADDTDDRREHWYYVAKGRKITNSVPTPRVSSTPAPPRGGEGGNHHAGARVFQHVVGVSAPT